MRNALTRRTSAVALAGVLALAGAACGDDEPTTDIDVTEEETTQPAVTEEETVVEEQTTIDTGGGATDAPTTDSTGTEMGTETATE